MSRIFKLSLTLVLLTSLLVVSALLSGCGDGGDGDNGDTTEYIYVPESTTSDGVIAPEQAGEGICFLNSFAKVGVELVCHGYPKDVTYNWTIVHMTNGEKETFSNTTGVYTPVESDLESMITVSVDGQEDLSIYCSELPVIYFTGDAKYKSISKAQYSDVYLTMQGNSYIQTGLYEGNAKLKLRGNSTANLDKRPFKLKLSSKENVLGMAEGVSKHWVLLANAIDHTLMRNKLLYDFSGAIGTEYYTTSENVVLIYNGEYCGVYQLCEQIRIAKDRVDVFDWDGVAGDIAEKLAKKLLDDGKIASDELDATTDDIESVLKNNWSWIDSGKFTYERKRYTLSSLGVTLPATTGGYLMEMDFYSQGNNALARLESAYRQPLYFSGPECESEEAAKSFMETSLYQNAYKFMQSFEYALHSDDFVFRTSDTHYWGSGWGSWGDWWDDSDATDNYGYTYYIVDYDDEEHDGWHYSEFFDMDSLVNNFIFCEFAMNWDSMKNSFFYYKDVDGKAKIGPQWDFDWAWGNINMYNIDTNYPESWHTTEDAFTVEQYYQKVQWNRMLIRDPYFLALAYEKYNEIRDTVIEDMIKDGGKIDTYMKTLRTSALANDYKWKKTYKSYRGEEYDDACASMLDFVETRIAWLDEQFESMDTFVESLGYYKTSSKLKVEEVTVGEKETTVTASVTDNKITKVTFQLNGTNFVTVEVKDGKATAMFQNSALNDEKINCVEIKARNKFGNYMYNSTYSNEGVYNLVYSNYKTFEK